MHDDSKEMASYQPSNEPTKEYKESAFKFWLESFWNEGPFTDTSEYPKSRYPNGHGYLDLGVTKDIIMVERIAHLYGYGVEHNYFGLTQFSQKYNEMMMLDFILLDLADELGYEFVEFEGVSSFAEETKNV